MKSYKECKKNKYKNVFKEHDIIFKEKEKDNDSNYLKKEMSDEEKELRYLCTDVFDSNYAILKHIRMIRRLKVSLNTCITIAAGALAGSFIISSPSNTTMAPTYKLERTVMSDDKIIKEVDPNIYMKKGSLPTDPEADPVLVDTMKTAIQYQVKDGTRSVVVTIDVDDARKMSVGGVNSGNFFDLNTSIFENVQESEIELKYQELLDDIDELVKDSVGSKHKKEIKEILSKEKASIITTVVEYVKTGDIEVVDKNAYYYLKKFGELACLAFMIAVCFISNRLGLGKIRVIECGDGYNLRLTNEVADIVPFKSDKIEKKRFVYAEESRELAIKRLVKDSVNPACQNYFDK